MAKWSSMTWVQRVGVFYGGMFFFVAIMGYIPAFVDADGYLFGLFALDLYDNSLHAFSGLWALIAALVSHKQAALYFKLFGTLYFFDGVMGLALGNAFLDFGIFQHGVADNTLVTNFFLNVPHILIGGFAALIGFFGSRLQRNTT